MPRLFLCQIGLLAAGALAPLTAADDLRLDEKGTYLGALFGPRPASQAAQATGPAGRPTAPPGAVVTHVLPGSPAEKANLRHGDVLLRYNQNTIRDPQHLARLIRADRPDRKVVLVVQRDQRLRLLDATLALGPVLKLSRGTEPQPAAPSVVVYAAPLGSGRMRLTIEYRAVGGAKKVVTCEGAADDVAGAVQKLPERERNLVRIAIGRLNTLNEAKPPSDAKR